MAGTSFLKPTDAGKLRFGANIVNLVGDRTQPGGLATTGYDDEGVKSERWHLVRDGMFVDWQTTRELAPLVGQQQSHGCLHADDWSSVPFPRMPNVSLEPAATEVSLDDLFSGIKRGLFIEGRGVSSIDQQRYNFQFGGAVIREITNGKLGAMVQRRRLSVADAGLLGVVRRPRRPGDLSPVGHVGRRQGRTRTDQRGQSRLSAGAVPQRHGAEHGGGVMLNSRRSARRSARPCLTHAKAAGAEDANVSLQSTVESHARFADNRITTSGRAEDLDITATVWVGKRRGAATGNDAGADALKQLADEAVQIARVSPVHREYVPTLGPLDLRRRPRLRRRAPRTSISPRAPRRSTAVLAACRAAKVTGAGFPPRERQPRPRSRTANGNRRYFRSTRGRPQRDGAQRRRHRLRLLRRRSLRSREARRETHRRRRRSARRSARSSPSRSSLASTRSSSNRRRSPI